MKVFIFIHIMLFPILSFSQWQNLGMGFDGPGYIIFYDSINSELFACGYFEYADSIRMNGFSTWDGLKWDSMSIGAPYGAPGYSITKYQGNIYASSAFSFTNSPPDYSNWFAKWNGQYWDTLNQKVNSAIYCFKEYNGELYLGGSFTKIGTQDANLLAKYDGVNFTPLSIPSEAGGFRVTAIEFFQGLMYVGGNFYDTLTGVNDMERWDGTSYQPFGGNGLAFGSDVVSAMEIYQNNLYIGGNFLISSGSPADNIMRWDGNQFYDVGGGLNGGIEKMHVFNNELYVCGDFTLAGSVPVNGLAKWNGNQWSAVVPGIFNNRILDFCLVGNDFYVTGGFTMIDTIQVNCIAKYSHVNKVTEIDLQNKINIFQNQFEHTLQIQSEFTLKKISIVNLFGQLIIDKTAENKKNIEISLNSFSENIYYIIIETTEDRIVKKFVKQ